MARREARCDVAGPDLQPRSAVRPRTELARPRRIQRGCGSRADRTGGAGAGVQVAEGHRGHRPPPFRLRFRLQADRRAVQDAPEVRGALMTIANCRLMIADLLSNYADLFTITSSIYNQQFAIVRFQRRTDADNCRLLIDDC